MEPVSRRAAIDESAITPARLLDLLEDAAMQGMPEADGGGFDSGAMWTWTEVGDLLVHVGMWERRPSGSARRAFYKRTGTTAQEAAGRLGFVSAGCVRDLYLLIRRTRDVDARAQAQRVLRDHGFAMSPLRAAYDPEEPCEQ